MVEVLNMGGVMFDVCRRMRRLFCLAVLVLTFGAAMHAATPAMTTISDTIYRADECLNASIWAKAK